jgi:ATP-binding cassette, subfamily B, bacterial
MRNHSEERMAETLHTHRAKYRETVDLVRLAVGLAWTASPGLVLALIAPTLVQALLPPATLALTRAVLDRAAFDRGLLPALDPLTAQLPLVAWAALAAIMLALGQVLQPIASGLQSLAGDRLTAALGDRVICAANAWPGLMRLEDPAFADDLRRAREQADRAGLEIVLYFVRTLIALVSAAALALLLAALHPLVPVLLLLAALPQMRSAYAYYHRTGSHLYVQTPGARQLEYSRDVTLRPEAAKDVRLYDLVPFFRRRYDRLFDETMGTLDTLRWRESRRVALAGLLAAGGPAMLFASLVWFAANGARTPGEIVLYGGAALLFQQQLVHLGMEAAMLPLFFGQSLPSLQRVLDAPPDLPLFGEPVSVPDPVRTGVVFEHVAFTYPGQTEPALRDVSFQLAPGECVALVGHNGAGKTTIVKLLLRLYDPSAGRILLDGVDLREYDLAELRRRVGAIFQDFARFELTAGENIGLGLEGALHDEGRIRTTAAHSGADAVIATLPKGLQTSLGRELGGRELSGGEWQKIALARAFMRDAPLLVLDEPTAALDVETEEAIYTRFHELTRGRMTLLISHRFATVRMADRILLLAHGRIAEAGSHRELLAQGGTYARLYQLQAARYQDDEV